MTTISDAKRLIAAQAAASAVKELAPSLVLLVGSVARGYADAGSDIALLVVDAHPLPPDGTVRQLEYEGEKVKLEFYGSGHFVWLQEQVGSNAVRQLNRLREARVLYDPTGRWPSIRPTVEAVRRAFGVPEAAILPVEEILSAASHSFALGEYADAVLRSCMAAEALALVFLSIGDVPMTYTKPKWTWLGITSIGDEGLGCAFTASTLGDSLTERGHEALTQAERWCEGVHGLIIPEERAADRALRRHLWLMDKHLQDSQSLGRAGQAVAMRSPLLMVASFGLGALARARGWNYEHLSDALTLRRRLGEPLCSTLTSLLFPAGLPDEKEAAQRYNASVTFYQLVLARLGIEEPED